MPHDYLSVTFKNRRNQAMVTKSEEWERGGGEALGRLTREGPQELWGCSRNPLLGVGRSDAGVDVGQSTQQDPQGQHTVPWRPCNDTCGLSRHQHAFRRTRKQGSSVARSARASGTAVSAETRGARRSRRAKAPGRAGAGGKPCGVNAGSAALEGNQNEKAGAPELPLSPELVPSVPWRWHRCSSPFLQCTVILFVPRSLPGLPESLPGPFPRPLSQNATKWRRGRGGRAKPHQCVLPQFRGPQVQRQGDSRAARPPTRRAESLPLPASGVDSSFLSCSCIAVTWSPPWCLCPNFPLLRGHWSY